MFTMKFGSQKSRLGVDLEIDAIIKSDDQKNPF